MSSSTVEEAFALIAQGNDEKTWKKADAYGKASSILATLTSDEAPVQELYRQQASHYRQKAQQAFIEGLQEQMERDSAEIPRETCLERQALFLSLFAPLLVEEQRVRDARNDQTLEERLAQLTANLPTNLQSESQRLQQVQQGLERLGVSLSFSSSTKPNLRPASEDDQVAQIMAQARDEVAMGLVKEENDDANDDYLADDLEDDLLYDDDDDDSPTPVDLTPESLLAIQDALADAQSKLAILAEELEDADVPNPKLLKEARLLLQQATRTWRNNDG